MGRRRSAAAILAAREASEIRQVIGQAIAAARGRRGWTQAQLAASTGHSQPGISRLERGVAPLEVEDVIRVPRALGLTPRLEHGRDPLDRSADAGHLAIQELLVRLARATADTGLVELPLGTGARSLSVDVCVHRRALGELIVEEAWSRVGDVGAGLRSFDRKLALAAEAGAAFARPPRIVTGVWVVRATRANRELLATYPALFTTRFLGSSRGWVRALTSGAPAPPEPGLVPCDGNASRLFEWRPAMVPSAPSATNAVGTGPTQRSDRRRVRG